MLKIKVLNMIRSNLAYLICLHNTRKIDSEGKAMECCTWNCKGTGVRLYVLDAELHLAAFCGTCAHAYWTRHPKSNLFSAGCNFLAFAVLHDVEAVYGRYRPYALARTAFVQRYDAALSCYRANGNGSCTRQVALYVSSAFHEGIPLCVPCANKGAPLIDAGIPVSNQYNKEVYHLLPTRL